MPVLCTVWWTWDVLGSQWWSLYSFALLVARTTVRTTVRVIQKGQGSHWG